MQARAKYDFVATEHDELSFTHGTIIKIISMEDDANWFKAELRGEVGYVPRTYIDMLPFPWFYGKISRSDSERLLLTERTDGKPVQADGAFLVRYSESSPGDLSISVKYANTVQHYKILRTGGKYYLWVVKFDSVNELIDYHRKSSISRSNHLPLVDMVDTSRGAAGRPGMMGAGIPPQLHQQMISSGNTFMANPSGPSANLDPGGSQAGSQLDQRFRPSANNAPRFADMHSANLQRSSQQFQQHPIASAPVHNQPGTGNAGMPQFVQAAFDFNPQDENEMGIRQGDVIRVIEKYDDNWLTGEMNGKVGLVPISYVGPYPQ